LAMGQEILSQFSGLLTVGGKIWLGTMAWTKHTLRICYLNGNLCCSFWWSNVLSHCLVVLRYSQVRKSHLNVVIFFSKKNGTIETTYINHLTKCQIQIRNRKVETKETKLVPKFLFSFSNKRPILLAVISSSCCEPLTA
jgi:hypothetical protein